MFINEKEYQHIINLMEKKEKPEPILEDLKKWFYDKYKITLYDYICDTSDNELIRLIIVLFDREDKNKMSDGVNWDKYKQYEISDKFSELAIQYNCHIQYQDSFKVLVYYETIKDEIAKRILKRAETEIKAISYKDIWKIEIAFETVHIFYQTDEQMARHQLDGIDESINSAVTKIIKEYDKYDIYKHEISCIFTSKQTFQEKYEGNMYYYLL